MTSPIKDIEKAVDVWKVLRYIGLAVGAVIVLQMARCGASKYQKQTDEIDAAKKNAQHWQDSATVLDAIRVKQIKLLDDTTAVLNTVTMHAQQAVARANALQHAIHIAELPKGPPAPSGAVALTDSAGNDTTSMMQATRDGDPRPYIIPRFIDDLLVAKNAAIDSLNRVSNGWRMQLLSARSTINDDARIIRARDSVIANTRVAEITAEARSAPRFGFKTGVAVGALGLLAVEIPIALLASHTGGK